MSWHQSHPPPPPPPGHKDIFLLKKIQWFLKKWQITVFQKICPVHSYGYQTYAEKVYKSATIFRLWNYQNCNPTAICPAPFPLNCICDITCVTLCLQSQRVLGTVVSWRVVSCFLTLNMGTTQSHLSDQLPGLIFILKRFLKSAWDFLNGEMSLWQRGAWHWRQALVSH